MAFGIGMEVGMGTGMGEASGELESNEAQTIVFVLIDNNCDPVLGLGNAFVVQYNEGTGALQAGLGVRGEIGLGWYWYTWLAAEVGGAGSHLAFDATGAGNAYQRLWYQVRDCPTIMEI